MKTDYGELVGEYQEKRKKLGSKRYEKRLLAELKRNSKVLDLGCGTGEPIDRLLVEAGHQVTGIDLANEMIREARKRVPEGHFFQRDIRELAKDEYWVDAVVSFYAMFHIPREEQGRILKTVGSYLPQDGLLVITMGDKDYEGKAKYLGKTMWWSQWAPTKNRVLVERAGFRVILDEMDSTGGELHQVIMARKK